MYCTLERTCNGWDEKQLTHLTGNLSLWIMANEEYANADFDRKEEICDVLEAARIEMARYLDEQQLRKFLKRNLSPDVTTVFNALSWGKDLERLVRLRR